MAGDEGRRKIRLFCPSASKMIDWVAWNDKKLDFGSIAAAFGLEPATVKLNGHFVSRGIDLLASCVTWQSLLAFFSVKGLSTGKDEADALLVDGKLSKVGTKRPYSDPQENLTCNDLGLIKTKKLKDKCCSVGESLISGCKRKLLSEDTHLLKKLKLNIDDSFDVAGRCNKRKLLSEETNSLKKLKLNMDDSFGRQSEVSTTPLKCSFISEGLKRTREDEMIVSASCKKIR